MKANKPPHVLPIEIDTELAELTTMDTLIENLTEEQKKQREKDFEAWQNNGNTCFKIEGDKK